jgi:EmrB/QacA subfamily drug resistance transporter
LTESGGAPLALVIVLSGGAVLTILDTTIVTVALDTLGRDLRVSVSQAQWISTAYLLTLAFAIPTTGWMTDRFGVTRVWIGALAVFVGASALCGAAWSAGSLIAFRAVQGFGAGLVMPVGQAIVVRAVGPAGLGRVMGLLNMPLLLGPVLGPVVGGVIVSHASWRYIFLVNVPLGVVTLAAARRVLPHERGTGDARLDWRGLALLSPGLLLLVYGITQLAPDHQAPRVVTVACLVAAPLLVATFCRHAWGRGSEALIELDLFRRVEFRAAAALAFIFGMLMFGAMFLLPLYYQTVRGASAMQAGLLMAPQGLGSLISLPIAGRLSDRFGAGRVVPVGLAVALVATAMFASATATTSYGVLGVAQFVRGLGLSAVMTPAYAAAYAALASSSVPRGASAMNILNRLGGSVGAALLAAVLAAGVAHDVPAAAGPDGLHALAQLSGTARHAVAGELASSFATGYAILVALTALAFVPAAFLPRLAAGSDSSPPPRPHAAPGASAGRRIS